MAVATLGRRDFLRLGGGLAAVPLIGMTVAGCTDPSATPAGDDAGSQAKVDAGPPPETGAAVAFDPQAVPLDAVRFALGVQIGSLRAHTGIAWGHTEGKEAAVLRVWRALDAPGAAGQVHLAVDKAIEPADGYLKTLLAGMRAGTAYQYAWFAADFSARSDIGRFRTAFAPGIVAPVTVGATACTRPNFAPFVALTRTAELGPDVFCHLGDMVYNDSAVVQADYRSRWRKALQDPGYRAVLGSCGTYQTWDDHEVTNDTKRYVMDPAQKSVALDAFFETLPIPRMAGNRFYDSYRWGASVEFFVLDCRGERQPESRLTEDPIYLSKAQLAWLQEGLAKSPCHFKVVLNSVPIIQFPELWFNWPDRWQGYAKQRDALLDHITAQGIRNVWFLAGDLHVGVVARIEIDGPRSKMFEILCGPGGNQNPIAKALMSDPDLLAQATPTAQFLHASMDIATTLLTFDPATDSVRVRFVDPVTGLATYDAVLKQPV